MIKISLAQTKHAQLGAKILNESYYDSISLAKQEIKLKIKTKECLVALVDKEVAGILLYTRSYSHYANYIDDIVVAKKYRGKGIAKLLLKKYIEISKKSTPTKQKYALSSTNITNKISINLHKSIGFKEIGTLKGLHYGKDEVFFAYKLR